MTMNWLSENADELVAIMLVVGGLYMAIFKNFQQGLTLIGLGTTYLFGKSMPKRPTIGGLPSG